MSRRVFFVDPKRKRLVQEALLTMRETRKTLDPAVLDIAKKALFDYAETHERVETPQKQAEDDRFVPVDMKKNLNIVMKFLELKADNTALRRQIKELLADYN